MSVRLYCESCNTSNNSTNKKCSKCGSVFPKTNKKYRIQFMVNGKRYVEYVDGSKKLAESIEIKNKHDLKEGIYFDRKKKIYTLDEIWSKYLEEYKIRGKSWKKEENRYNNMLQKEFGNKNLNSITSADIERYKIRLTKTKTVKGTFYSPKTIKIAIELITRLYKYAIKMDLYDGMIPSKKIKLPEVNNQSTRSLTDAQMKKLLDVLNNYEDQTKANSIKFLLYTGLRAGEVFKLTWDCIDFKNKIIFLKNPKGGKDQYLPLNKLAIELLEEQKELKPFCKEGKNLVFPSTTGIIRANLHKIWRPIARLAGIPDEFRGHDLRHNFASWLASSGKVDIYTLQSLLTHKNIKTTQRYAHLFPGVMQKGVEIFDDVVEEAVKDKKPKK